MSNGNRKKVTKITVEFEDGTKKTYPDSENGPMPVALFWCKESDPKFDAVVQILGPYYEGKGRRMPFQRLKDRLGEKRALAVSPNQTEIVLDKNVIETLWNTPNPDQLPPLLAKYPGCDIGG